ncbi:TFC4 [Candida oxycetoniae]|uniref:TFC4 n=1 Tax=Candida oxycetoniae TaxID=497107 RepID=A0AAI9T1M4_9ASCO|nr:TFC4 [Candida oxycetoniae]KAI3406719.2 TFC4 [Candida oxycetoniae]
MSFNNVLPSANYFETNSVQKADSSDDSDENKLERVLNELDNNSFDDDDDDDDDSDDDNDGTNNDESKRDEDGLIYNTSDDDEDFLFEDESEEEEDDYNEDYNFKDALKGASNFRVRNKRELLPKSGKFSYKQKMTRSENRELDPEVRMHLSEANEAFVRNDLQVALQLYTKVIKKDAKNFSAYKAIGEIHKSLGNLNDCCNSWMLAASIHPWDTEFWSQVAELSADLGHIDQAIYCYNKSITSDINKSAENILQRAILYKEKRQFGKALDGFQKIRALYPTDSNILKNIAGIYSEQRRLNDAINLYMKVLDWNINPKPSSSSSSSSSSAAAAAGSSSSSSSSSSGEVYPRFEWTELNILLELHLQYRSYRFGLNVLKLAARWIQGRSDETWWDESDDSEFDPKRRFRNLSKNVDKAHIEEFEKKPYKLPIDIRFKLGALRLGLGDKEEALLNFEFLLEDDPDGIADLHFETGKLLEEAGLYEEALTYLTQAQGDEEVSTSFEFVQLLGKCYFEVGDFMLAKDAYEDLLRIDPENADYKLAFAETLYHLGDDAKAERLINEVKKSSMKSSSSPPSSLEWKRPSFVQENTENLSLIKNRILKGPKRARLTEHEKEEMELNAKRKVLEKYGRMERLQESVNAGDKIAISAWIQLATPLIEMFTNVKSFFPRDRMKKFKGIVKYTRRKDMDLNEKLARAYNLLEGISQGENYVRQTLISKSEYRGLTYQQWFEIFAQFAFVLWKYNENAEYADEILNVALSVSVFAQDKKKEAILQVLKIILGISQNQPSTTIQTYVRLLLNANQFSPFICKFFICSFVSGYRFWETFANYNQQKYFLRQLKAYDSSYSKVHITGMSNVTANLSNVTLGECHADLVYIYGNLLGGNRSYSSSIFYMNRAYEHYNRDPMICLMLALSHLHRSMQRLSANRHIQLLQGISYFLEYQQHRSNNGTLYEIQEIQYNFGRLFHTLGLSSLAIRHYNKVLSISDENELDDDYNLSREAAYNLSLIYNLNGNTHYASELAEKYLVI